jgi:hypothetical protein
MLGSLKGVHEASAVGAWLGSGRPQIQGAGAGVESGGGHPSGVCDPSSGAAKSCPGQRPAPEDPPPAFLEVQPACALGDERVPDAGMILQPGPGALAVVAGQLEEVLVEGAVAGQGAHGDHLPAGDAQPAVDPGLLRAAGVLQRRLDPVPAGRPARRGRKVRGITGPSSSAQITGEPGGEAV